MPMTINDQNGNILGSNTNPLNTVTLGGQTVVTQTPILVSTAPKAPFQTMKTFTGTITTQTGATTIANLYTVSTGKTFYLTDVIMCNNSANVSQVSINASVTPGASPVMIGHTLNTSPLSALNIGTEPSIAAGNPVVVQAGQTSVATSVTYFVAGYEQ
jgi:hypothetical protein